MATQRSSLAVQVDRARDPAKGGKVRKPFGAALHTTGSGILSKAKAQGKTPIEAALDTYIAMQNGSQGYPWGGPAYVIDHDGTAYQIAPDDIVTHHSGPGGSGSDDAYRGGVWEAQLPASLVARWRAAWPGRAHPYSLFPSSSPNTDYIGIEMIPIGSGYGGAPMRAGLRFTQRQHDTAARLVADMAQRHGWPAGFASSNRLVGHEDVDPINRHDAGGGWDPGWLRSAPYFDFAYVRRAAASAFGSLAVLALIALGAVLLSRGGFVA
jgi:hypothetical protein